MDSGVGFQRLLTLTSARDKIGERLEALIKQWNATNEKGKHVDGTPYSPKDYA